MNNNSTINYKIFELEKILFSTLNTEQIKIYLEIDNLQSQLCCNNSTDNLPINR